MRLTLVLKYTRKTKSGIGYRRALPPDVAALLRKKQFVYPLGKTEKEAAENYRAAERAYLNAVQRARTGTAARTAFEIHREAVSKVVELGFPPEPLFADDPLSLDAEGEDLFRSEAAENILAKYPKEPTTGEPLGLDPVDEAMVRVLLNGAKRRPELTLLDAVKLYKEEKISGGKLEIKKKTQRVDRLLNRLLEVLGGNTQLRAIGRTEAKRLRDLLLEAGLKPSSVRRELNVVKAIFNHAIHECGLSSYMNPFNRLDIPRLKEEADFELRDPLPMHVLEAVRARVLQHCNTELKLIWRLLEGTGCRLAEITGLRVSDVVASGEMPHICVQWHEDRRIKTNASRRDVPLVGDALAAADEALKRAVGREMLFPRYADESGPGNASMALMKQLRKVSQNERHALHSLRHNMADRLLLAEVPELTKNMILGHSLGGVGNRQYGGDVVRLKMTTGAMRKAFGVVE